MKDRLIIEFGSDSLKIVKNDQDITIYINQGFDLIENEDLIFKVQKMHFHSVLINIPIDHSVFKHICVLVSLLGKSVPVFVRKKAKETDDFMELTENIKNLDIDFHCHQLQWEDLDDVFSRNLIKEITKLYVEKLGAVDFDLSLKDKPQSDVESLFSHVGLSHDLIMRDEFLSGHPYWCYPLDNSSGKLVRTVDLRLYYANFLAEMANNENSTFLEVGAGSGFTTHYLSSLGFNAEGSELSEYRVKGAKLLGKVKGTTTNFTVGNLRQLFYENASFDIVFSCFVLEQCQEILEEAVAECVRVARDKCVFFEPSTEFFPTLPSMIHNPLEGHPLHLGHFLLNKGFKVSVMRPRFQHAYNSGCIFIIDLNAKDTTNQVPGGTYSLLKT